ncbi:hypothetical protein DFH11DRAFT_1732277 [Phellopilus nigrolimitatus]|nr:hypothetical protein DFH11DRAFT_1732277 [Phellopilus nigrolimitatus]
MDTATSTSTTMTAAWMEIIVEKDAVPYTYRALSDTSTSGGVSDCCAISSELGVEGDVAATFARGVRAKTAELDTQLYVMTVYVAQRGVRPL